MSGAFETVSGEGGQEMPLLEAGVLGELAEEPGGAGLAWRFALDYAGLWGQRRHRLMESVGREDRDDALEAVISLKVSSAMVGSPRLADLAGRLEAVIRDGDLQEAAALLALIGIQGQRTVEELQRRYGREHP